MNIRKSNSHDIDDMMHIFHQAQAYFKNHNIDQWQNNYPNIEQIQNDQSKNCSYVIEDEHIVGTMFFANEIDHNYDHIEGQWKINYTDYAVIHRIAIADEYKGHAVAKQLLDFAVEICHQNNIQSIRIDTHLDNLSMQKFLTKNGFQFCGNISLENGDPRIAFEKVL